MANASVAAPVSAATAFAIAASASNVALAAVLSASSTGSSGSPGNASAASAAVAVMAAAVGVVQSLAAAQTATLAPGGAPLLLSTPAIQLAVQLDSTAPGAAPAITQALPAPAPCRPWRGRRQGGRHDCPRRRLCSPCFSLQLRAGSELPRHSSAPFGFLRGSRAQERLQKELAIRAACHEPEGAQTKQEPAALVPRHARAP